MYRRCYILKSEYLISKLVRFFLKFTVQSRNKVVWNRDWHLCCASVKVSERWGKVWCSMSAISNSTESENCIKMGKKSIKVSCQCTHSCAFGPVQSWLLHLSLIDYYLLWFIMEQIEFLNSYGTDFKHQRL